MIWFSKRYDDGNYTEEFDKFESLFMSLRGPRDMMMICTGKVGHQTVYVGLPTEPLAAAFDGYARAIQLPEEATLLIGHQDEFQKQFKFPPH